MENIEKFLMACRAMGVQDSQLVGVIHIFEMKDTPDVVECLVSLYIHIYMYVYLQREGTTRAFSATRP